MKLLNLIESFVLNELSGYYQENVDIVYKDNNLVVLAPKTSKAASKYSRGTEWCSQSSSGFCSHRRSEMLFRFLFKDGYKLRLNTRKDGVAGHWGGPKGETTSYPMLHFMRNPKNIRNLNFVPSNDNNLMIQHINSIPDNIMSKVINYTNDNLKEVNEAQMKSLSTIKQYLPDNAFANTIYNEHLKEIVIEVNCNKYRFVIDSNGNIRNTKKNYKVMSLENTINFLKTIHSQPIKESFEIPKEDSGFKWLELIKTDKFTVKGFNSYENKEFYFEFEKIIDNEDFGAVTENNENIYISYSLNNPNKLWDDYLTHINNNIKSAKTTKDFITLSKQFAKQNNYQYVPGRNDRYADKIYVITQQQY